MACEPFACLSGEMHTGGSPTCVLFLPISVALDVQTMFSLLGSGGGALLPVPGWEQEHFPSTFAIQAKEKSAAARIAKGSKKGSKN